MVASSIAVPSVPCFHPNLSFLFSMSQGLYTRKTWSTERPVYQHSLLLKLASGVFLTRHGFCFDGQKQNSTKICQHVQKISLCYKVYKRPLFSPDVNFAFKGQNGTQRKSMNDKNHETCAKNHRDRRKWS